MNKQNFVNFIGNVIQDNPVYVIGAGVSAGLVPTASEIIFKIKKNLLLEFEAGILPEQSKIIYALSGDTEIDESKEIMRFLVNHEGKVNVAYDYIICQHAIKSIKENDEIPIQYKYFLLPPLKTTIININNDGLAEYYYHKVHNVLDIQGSVMLADVYLDDNKLVRQYWKPSFLEGLNKHDHDLIRDGYPPAQNILVRPGYSKHPKLIEVNNIAKDTLGTSKNIVIIGYSFPKYDIHIKDLLIKSCKNNHPNIYVIDIRDPYGIAGEFAEQIKCNKVIPLQFDWQDFSKSILSEIEKKRFPDLSKHDIPNLADKVLNNMFK